MRKRRLRVVTAPVFLLILVSISPTSPSLMAAAVVTDPQMVAQEIATSVTEPEMAMGTTETTRAPELDAVTAATTKPDESMRGASNALKTPAPEMQTELETHTAAHEQFRCPALCENCALVPAEPTPGIMVHCHLDLLTVLHDDLRAVLHHPSIRFLLLTCPPSDGLLQPPYIRRLSAGSFAGMPGLEELHITDCALRALTPELFTGLPRLRVLNMTRSLGDASILVPGWLEPVGDTLQVLILHGCRLTTFSTRALYRQTPHYGNTSKGGTLLSLSPYLPKMSHLDLSRNSISAVNSTEIRQEMPALQFLYLTNNRIRSVFPNAFTLLSSGLHTLDLRNNQLSSLNKDLNQNCTNSRSNDDKKSNTLTWLNLQHNRLTHISPSFFACFRKLQYVDMTGNPSPVQSLASSGLDHLTELKGLYLSGNGDGRFQLSPVLSHMRELVEFSCANCGISYIVPAAFRNTTKLQVLKLIGNELFLVRTSTFTHLPKLKNLDLSQNKIKNLYLDAIIPSLQQLRIGLNSIRKLPMLKTQWPGLSILDLVGNDISTLSPMQFQGLTDLTGLRISHNNISSIPGHAFWGLSKLTVLNLSWNRITEIEYNAFRGLISLTHLNLGNNRILELEVFLRPLVSIQRLYATNNHIVRIREADLPVTLQYLDLSFNRITKLDYHSFIHLDQLMAINLTHNQIKSLPQGSLDMSPAAWLRPQVFLRGNWLECDCNLEWLRQINSYSTSKLSKRALVPDLYTVGCTTQIGKGRLFVQDRATSDFLCTYDADCDHFRCSCCYADGCACTARCFDICTCFRNSDTSINIMDCTMRNLSSPLPSKTPYFIQKLFLDGNFLPVVKASDFGNFPYLQELFVNRSGVEVVHDFAFHRLASLRSIYLQDNLVERVGRATFRNASTVERLYLHSNNLYLVESQSLDDLHDLKVLSLHNNNLTYIDLSLFQYLVSLKDLTLHGNPWLCDCEFGPHFQRWLFANSEKVSNSKRILCTVPKMTKQFNNDSSEQPQSHNNNAIDYIAVYGVNKPLMDLDFEFCRNTTVLSIIQERRRSMVAGTISMATAFAILILTGSLIYRSRMLIRVWLYNRYGVRVRRVSEDEDNAALPYDVFIARAEEDRDFVLDIFLPKLEEGDVKYKINFCTSIHKVCVEDRDWLGDQPVAQCTVASITQSKRTLLIVSDDYFSSLWCKFIFDTAFYYVLKDKQRRIILVLMDYELRHRLEPDLQLYMKTGNYLVYGERWFWHKLRYMLPDNPRGGPEANDRPLDVSGGARFRYLNG